MSEPFVAEIRIFPFNFAPRGWMMCNGQLLPISQYTAVFSLIGTYYGGDGRSTFGLPDLRGNFPVNQGNGPGLTPRVIGEVAGEAAVTLLTTEIPQHNHNLTCVTTGGVGSPSGAIFGSGGRGKQPGYAAYAAGSAKLMAPTAISLAGGNQPHENRPPFLAMNFCICISGIFPARS